MLDEYLYAQDECLQSSLRQSNECRDNGLKQTAGHGLTKISGLVIPTGGRNPWSLTMKHYYIYIMTSPSGTLYTGLTNNLQQRVYEHKNKLIEGFTKKYNVTRLVYFEQFHDVRDAIAREKQIKSWRRSKKLDLIKSLNPT